MRLRNVGTHTVDGVEPGERFDELDEPTARRRAHQGSVSWDEYLRAYVTPAHVCETCGFEAASARGLATHRRSHEETT